MTASKIAPHIRNPSDGTDISDYLIYEILDGLPIFYNGYKDVLLNKKQADEIKYKSSQTTFILSNLFSLFLKLLDDDKYIVLCNLGFYINEFNNLTGNIVIYGESEFKGMTIDEHYADVPPKIAIEVDVTADTSDIGGVDTYVYKKVRKLLDFGVERVIWINTATKTILIADDNLESWIVQDWNKDIEILEGLTINIPAFLLKKKIVVK
jgi:Uma2 family endonuclease